MKDLFKSLLFICVFMGPGLLTSCKKRVANPVNCSTNAEKVSSVANTYAANPNRANCEAYKNAVNDFYKSCATFYTGATKAALDQFMATPCPN